MVLAEQEDGVCQDYATLKTSGLHYSGAFAQGNVAMMNMGTWFISTLIEKIKTGEYTDCTNWGIAKYPHADGVEAGSTLATITSLAIPTNAPHKDLAWEFVNFVSGAEGAEALNTANLYLEMPVHPKSSEIETALNEAHDAIMTGSMSVDDGIAQMDEQVSAILAE